VKPVRFEGPRYEDAQAMMYAAVQASKVEMSMMEERRINEERFKRATLGGKPAAALFR